MTRLAQFACVILAFFLMQMASPIPGFPQKAAESELDSKVGVIYRDRESNLLLDIPNSNLKEGTRVVIITMPGQSLYCCGQAGAISSVRSEGIQQAMFDHGKSTTYKVKMDKKHHDVAFGFGIIDAPSIFPAKVGKVVADLNRDGVLETFRDCTSREGVHLTIWSGQPLKGSRLWHAYFYLGYDTEPSCVERDFE